MANDITKLIDLENLSTYKGYSDTAYEPHATTISWAQYQALTPEQKSNGNTYYIPDAPTGLPDLGSMIFVLTGTLTAGQTSLTFTDSRLTNNSLLDFFYLDSDVTFDSFTQNSATSFTLTFTAQASDLTVKVLVYNL